MINFCISSNINFYEKTLPVLVHSLMNSEVPVENIYFFIGGSDKYQFVDNEYGINLFYVPHNSFDFTALVSVIELDLKSKFWFLLHDTCFVDLEFYHKLNQINLGDLFLVPLTSDARSMNMGLYSDSFILNKKDFILKNYKNTNYETTELQKFKSRLVEQEDTLFDGQFSFTLNRKKRIVSEPVDFYKNGVLRIVEKFPDIGLSKVKANWFVKKNYTINI